MMAMNYGMIGLNDYALMARALRWMWTRNRSLERGWSNSINRTMAKYESTVVQAVGGWRSRGVMNEKWEGKRAGQESKQSQSGCLCDASLEELFNEGPSQGHERSRRWSVSGQRYVLIVREFCVSCKSNWERVKFGVRWSFHDSKKRSNNTFDWWRDPEKEFGTPRYNRTKIENRANAI